MGVHLMRRQRSPAGSSAGGGSMPPKGCVAVRVVGPCGGGATAAAEQEEERFVVPVANLKHPLFVGLLKEAEEEYGFMQQGAITIPCGVDTFRRVQGIIGGGGGGLLSGGGAQHHHGSGHLGIAACFRA